METPNFNLNTEIVEKGFRLFAEKMGHPTQVIQMMEFDLPKYHDIPSDNVFLEILASPIDYADLLNIRGLYGTQPPSFPLFTGNEGIFKVLAKGPDVKKLDIGDIVFINSYGLGTWSSHLTLHETAVVKLEQPIDIVSGSMLRVNMFTAYRMLHDFVKLNNELIVVQNGATSHVGQTVIQLCKSMGVKTINIIRQPQLSETYNILKKMGADEIVTIEHTDNVDMKKIMSDLKKNSWFDQTKVVLGLNCIGGVYSQIVENLLACGSTHVTYGGILKKSMEASISSLIFKNIKFVGFLINKWLQDNNNSKFYDMMLHDTTKLIHNGSYFRPPFKCFPLSQYKSVIETFHNDRAHSILPYRIIFTKNINFIQHLATIVAKL
uniref:Enoyl-[acyl-carrier-protein] reductase, mitochondrial n=1 Tax=Myxobolus squamalis TaxID=59785 RepID=A0A6B2G481_MYXSQ